MKLSLAIVNDNQAPYLERLFQSLGSWKDAFDIVFVDNCSGDESVRVAKAMKIKKIVALQKKAVSRPVLYNKAASMTDGQYVLFTHSDVIFGDGFFENLDKTLQEATPLDFMNFRVMYVNKTTIAPNTISREFENTRIKLSHHSMWAIDDPVVRKIMSCSEPCFLVNSRVFEYEYFDERYLDSLFLEDLILKLYFRGANIVYDEDSHVEHYFLEEHKKLRTLRQDMHLFEKNNLKALQAFNLIEQDKQIDSLETSLRDKVTQIHRLESQIRRLESRVYRSESQLWQIQHSIPMQLVNRYQRVVEKLLRRGTLPRRCYELMLTGIRVILTEGWSSFWARFKERILQNLGRGQADSMPLNEQLTGKATILPDKSTNSRPAGISAPASRYSPKLRSKAQFLMYDVSNEILRRNWEVIERFRNDPHLQLNSVLWILPAFDQIYRGGVYTILRVADSFSRRFGTVNLIALHTGADVALPELQPMIRSAFPSLKFELTVLRDLSEADDLPPSDAAFCTLWTTAYVLVRYNKCKAKFYFLQDFEPAFSAAGSTYGLIEQTYRFGFVGIANTPGVGELYRHYNPWVQYFIPGVDKSIFYPEPERSADRRIRRIVFYGRPRNNRNAFELGAAALSLVKNELGDAVEISSVGADFSESKYGVKGILKNRGVLRSMEEVAALYRSSDVGLVFMYTAHPSYQPFEFMASGCATISNFNRYTQWFLRDGENAALTHSTPTCVAERILEVLQDEELRHRIIEGGLKTVSTLEWGSALERITKFVCDPSPSRSPFLSGDTHFHDTTTYTNP